MYHQVTPAPAPSFRKYAVTPRAFAAQMAWLSLTGFTPINLNQLADHRSGIRILPSKPVIITFDDGYRDCIDYAVPVLQKRGFTAVFYLVTGRMGQTTSWLVPKRGLEFPVMDWTSAKVLAASGFQCASHTLSHPDLAELAPRACRAELYDSRSALEDRLGHPVRHLAYPYGSVSPRVREIAAEVGYESACSVEIGFASVNADWLALPRVPVNGQDSLLDFVSRLYTARPANEVFDRKARGAVRRIRQRGGARA